MKTTPEHVTRWRNNHHAALETLASEGTPTGAALWRKLRRIEARASRLSCDYCNGDATPDQWEKGKARIIEAVKGTLGTLPPGFFVNSDPRGYALKIDPDKGTVPEGMHTDWGRYGILAAEIDA